MSGDVVVVDSISCATSMISIAACITALYLYYPLHRTYRRYQREGQNEANMNLVLVLVLVCNLVAALNIALASIYRLLERKSSPVYCKINGFIDELTCVLCSALMILFAVDVRLCHAQVNVASVSAVNTLGYLVVLVVAGAIVATSSDMLRVGDLPWCTVTRLAYHTAMWVVEALAALANLFVFVPLLRCPIANHYERSAIRSRFAFAVILILVSVVRAVTIIYENEYASDIAVAVFEPSQGVAYSAVFIMSEGLWLYCDRQYDGNPYGFAFGLTSLGQRLASAGNSPTAAAMAPNSLCSSPNSEKVRLFRSTSSSPTRESNNAHARTPPPGIAATAERQQEN